VHLSQISRQSHDRIFVRLEAGELRMVAVSFRFTPENFLCEQCFTPQRDKSLCVEIFWV